jgi:hypothetical protein
MLNWLVSIVFACTFLLGGAFIAMEAMGLMFLAAPDDPEHRLEAVVAQIEASVDPRDVPNEGEAEGLWPPLPEKHAKEEQAKGDKAAALIPADLTDAGPPPAPTVVAAGTARVVVAETEPEIEAERDALDPIPPAPKLVAVGKTADPIVPTPAPEPDLGAKACAGACNTTKAQAPKRPRPSRTDGHVDWLASLWTALSLP